MVSARVQKIIQNLHHVRVFVHSEFAFQPLDDLLDALAALDIVAEML